MDPNDKFKSDKILSENPCVSVANLPSSFCIKDPDEYRRDMQDMLEEMGYCPGCKDMGVRYKGKCSCGYMETY